MEIITNIVERKTYYFKLYVNYNNSKSEIRFCIKLNFNCKFKINK